MKTILLAATLVCGTLVSQAQINAAATMANGDSTPIEVIAKGLAQIAMENNSAGKAEAANVMAAEYSYKAQKTAWLDNLRAQGNLNEFTLKRTLGVADPNVPLARAFWPRYNFGVNIPFGIFTNQPKQTKVALYRWQAEQETMNAAKQNIGVETQTAYYDYIRTQRLYELQEEALQDAAFASSKTEEQFSKGQVTLEYYTATSRRYNTERASKVSLERDMMVSKAQLELLLGMPIEAALVKVHAAHRGNSRR